MAYAIDIAVGDPPSMPHPVRLMGRAIIIGERICKPGEASAADSLKGAVLSILVATMSWISARWAIALARQVSPAFGTAVEITLAWSTLATGSLISEAGKVLDALRAQDMDEARRAVSMIVGRDTDALDSGEIARAVIETVAEGLCDGIAAPLFYSTVGGVPLAMAYKAINTLDSMIGHPEPPYTYFGRFAARTDDVANFLPARATALAIVLASGIWKASGRNAWRIWLRDGHKHPSPNAGQSESAMAGALGVQLGGKNYYRGVLSEKPLLGRENRVPSVADAENSLRLARAASVYLFAAALIWLIWKRRA